MTQEQLKWFVTKEQNDINWINWADINNLNKIVDKDKNNILDEEVKKDFWKTENIKTIFNGINIFLYDTKKSTNKTNLENLCDKANYLKQNMEYLKSYSKILQFLLDWTNKLEIWNKKWQISEMDKTALINAISKPLNEIKQKINEIETNRKERKETQEEKQKQEAEQKKQEAEQKAIETRWRTDFISMIKGVVGSMNSIDNIKVDVSKIDFDGLINMFMEQYNANSDLKIDNKNLLENMYNLPNERKDLFAGYLSQIVFISFWQEKTRGTKIYEISKYRKAIFPKLFKEGQKVPLLLDQQRIMVGDKSSTQWLIPWTNANAWFWLWWYEYNTNNPEEQSGKIWWLEWQTKLKVSFMAAWVDHYGATIKVNIWWTIIEWKTKWQIWKQDKDWNNIKDADWNIIEWNKNINLPKWVSFSENWSIIIDSKIYWSKPIVEFSSQSLKKDEVFITAWTDWEFIDKNSLWWQNEKWRKEWFEPWERKFSEEGTEQIDKTISEISKIIDKRLPDGYNLMVNIWSSVDNTPYDKDYKPLEEELDKTKKYLISKGYLSLVKDVEEASNKSKFNWEWNKYLAELRALNGIKTIIDSQKINEKNKKRISFNITKINTEAERKFTMETGWVEKPKN